MITAGGSEPARLLGVCVTMSVPSSYPRTMRRILALLTAVILVSWGTAMLSPAGAADGDQVCSGLDSGKIDVSGEPSSLTLTAP